MIGTKNDPLCPLESAEETQLLLRRSDGKMNSSLIKYMGFGHSSLSQPSQCITNLIRLYFLSGYIPPDGTVCKPNQANIFD
jgi:hypothetical protein